MDLFECTCQRHAVTKDVRLMVIRRFWIGRVALYYHGKWLVYDKAPSLTCLHVVKEASKENLADVKWDSNQRPGFQVQCFTI